jgi:hypothetical protein
MIAIGALGGSGTRAIAEVLIQSGIYMGDDLNNANDNLIYTRLFKNPDWYANSSDIKKPRRMRVFENYMRFNKLSFRDLIELFIASKSNPTFHSTAKFYLRNTKKLFGKGIDRVNWGWKEPNTQIYMLELLNFFDKLKYIHVLRHGLDMAFSNNKQQLKNWGWKYNIILDENETGDELAIKQLDYWIESTKDVLEKSKQYNNRFLLINHTNFCNQPKAVIDKILAFSDIKVTERKKKNCIVFQKKQGQTIDLRVKI